MNIKTILIILVAAAALTAGFWFGQARQNNTESVNSGATPIKLIDFTLPDITGKPRKLSEWQGRVIILNFWATWCPPCRKEIPMFLDYYEKYRGQGLEIIGVAIDKKEDVEAFIDTLFINYPVLLGGTEMMTMMRRYGNRVGSLPYNVLIDRDGKILNTKKGAYTHAELEALLTPLFKKN